MGLGGQLRAPTALPRGKTRYTLYRSLGGPHGLYGQVRKISTPQGFDPRIVQPLASRYSLYLNTAELEDTTNQAPHGTRDCMCS